MEVKAAIAHPCARRIMSAVGHSASLIDCLLYNTTQAEADADTDTTTIHDIMSDSQRLPFPCSPTAFCSGQTNWMYPSRASNLDSPSCAVRFQVWGKIRDSCAESASEGRCSNAWCSKDSANCNNYGWRRNVYCLATLYFQKVATLPKLYSSRVIREIRQHFIDAIFFGVSPSVWQHVTEQQSTTIRNLARLDVILQVHAWKYDEDSDRIPSSEGNGGK